jgi:hypothetical protein
MDFMERGQSIEAANVPVATNQEDGTPQRCFTEPPTHSSSLAAPHVQQQHSASRASNAEPVQAALHAISTGQNYKQLQLRDDEVDDNDDDEEAGWTQVAVQVPRPRADQLVGHDAMESHDAFTRKPAQTNVAATLAAHDDDIISEDPQEEENKSGSSTSASSDSHESEEGQQEQEEEEEEEEEEDDDDESSEDSQDDDETVEIGMQEGEEATSSSSPLPASHAKSASRKNARPDEHSAASSADSQTSPLRKRCKSSSDSPKLSLLRPYVIPSTQLREIRVGSILEVELEERDWKDWYPAKVTAVQCGPGKNARVRSFTVHIVYVDRSTKGEVRMCVICMCIYACVYVDRSAKGEVRMCVTCMCMYACVYVDQG